jgi:hypothetical protein
LRLGALIAITGVRKSNQSAIVCLGQEMAELLEQIRGTTFE